MHWNFSKWDWGEILQIVIPVLFAALFGIMLAFIGGALVLEFLFDTLFTR